MKRILPVFLLIGSVAGCSSVATPPGVQSRKPDYSQYTPDEQDRTPTLAAYEADPTSGPAASDAAPRPTPANVREVPSNAPPADVNSDIAAVKGAKGPAAAMDAYSHGMAANPNSALLEEAFVQKMVEFDSAQYAVGAARRLLGVAPDSGVARAVVAFDEARHGDLPDAIEDITLAARKLPDHPFVQQQAARIYAWYDSTSQQPPVPAGLKKEIATAREKLGAFPAYADAYKQAVDFYKEARRAATQPSTPAGNAYGPDQGYDEAAAPITPYYPPPVYEPEPYPYAAEPYYYPDYNYYAGWSPFFVGTDFIFFDHFFHHDRFRDHGHFRDHDHDGDRNRDGRGSTVSSRTEHGVVHPSNSFNSGAVRGLSSGNAFSGSIAHARAMSPGFSSSPFTGGRVGHFGGSVGQAFHSAPSAMGHGSFGGGAFSGHGGFTGGGGFSGGHAGAGGGGGFSGGGGGHAGGGGGGGHR